MEARPKLRVCGRCGSIQMSKPRQQLADQVIGLFTGRVRVLCRRCGWRGTATWRDSEDTQVIPLSSDDGVDPELAVLDQPRANRRRGPKNRRQTDTPSDTKPQPEFDLSTLHIESQTVTRDPLQFDSHLGRTDSVRRIAKRRSRRSIQREVFAAMFISVLILIVVTGFNGSCATVTPEF